MIVSRQTIAAEVMRQTANQPAGTSDEAILQAVAEKLAIPLALVAEAIDRQTT